MIEVVRQCICCVGRIDASAQTSSSLIGCPARSMQQFGWSNRGTYSGLARAANVSLRIECASEERPAWTETGARAQRRDHLGGRGEVHVERGSFGWDGTVHREPLSIQARVRTLRPYSATESIPPCIFHDHTEVGHPPPAAGAPSTAAAQEPPTGRAGWGGAAHEPRDVRNVSL